ncbi:prepilin-type N-terminal cleavage/methylation domain-containing protein [Enterococcus sp. BWT-B8]|uniref:type II secretion system protein n=1 Tax=Enterococcus sp. BWT-B8 TaxID=2885157 RepID=UPI001E3239D6|nr:prepilin-type N-terminal cleavage/methylation domain-containing protein [Enterococcus sp. BWT-B8]MCB5952531.1 prepilin-type N-terminal cleavage/methylation domain-containing protein [Enterococcus sp. BWT-B8]
MIEALTFQEESRMSRLLKDERGMTLIELLATVVILAIIAGIGIVAIGNVIQNSREDSAVAEVQQAMSAANLYQLDPSIDGDSFNLEDVKEAKYLQQAGNWASLENVQFTVQDDGTLVIDVPADQLSAGNIKNKSFTGNADAVAVLSRAQLFHDE